MRRFVLFLTLLCGLQICASAQRIGIKTNAAYWLTATPNIGMEFGLAPRWTLEIAGGYNPWTYDKEQNLKTKHFLVTPEVRYWFCECLQGHFIGINGNYGMFNFSKMPVPNAFLTTKAIGPVSEGLVIDNSRNHRYEGWAAGAGITYGYAWVIGRRWNMEANIGLGYWYVEYDRYENKPCGLYQGTAKKHLFGPTDLGLSFIYLIK